MNKAFMVLGGGVLLYYLFGQQKPAASPAPAATPAAAIPPAAQTPGPSVTAPAAVSNAAQRAAIVAYINGSGVSSTFVYGQQTPDTWNWYAMRTFEGWNAPDPETLYPGEPNVHSKTYTFDDWFKRITPYLPGMGMSGLESKSQWYAVGPGGWMA